MTNEELSQIEKVGAKAITLLNQGSSIQAMQELKKLEASYEVSEATKVRTIVTAYSQVLRKKTERAKEICLHHNYSIWNNPDGLYLVRQAHSDPDEATQLFSITVKGGIATFGPFRSYSHEHYCDFQVVANDEFEAIRYIDELARFKEPHSKLLIHISTIPIGEIPIDKRGVYYCSPFRVTETEEENFE